MEVSQTIKKKYLQAGLGKRSDPDVAATLGVSRERVRQVRSALNIPPPRAIIRAKDRDRVARLAEKGLTAEGISKRTGLAIDRVRALAREAEVTLTRGRQGARPKYTEEMVREALASSDSLREATKKLGCGPTTIYRLIKRYGLRGSSLPDGRRRKQDEASNA